MMTVTKIEPLSKTRYKVYLDGQFAFTLYKGELSRYHIAEESVIEDDIYDSLQQIITKRAKLRAMHLLSDMGRTESQLRRKLKQGGQADSRKERKSKKELYAALVQKGVSSEIVEQVFEEADYGEEDSRQAIEALMRKRNYNPETADAKEKQKMMGYLMRKGFSYQDVRNVLQVCE